MAEFEVTASANQLKALARDLRAAGDAGKGIRKDLRKAIVAGVDPMKKQAQQNALAIPSKHVNRKGLRSNIARAIRVKTQIAQANSTVTLFVDPNKMPIDQRRVPILMEGESRRPWRHPIFGDRDHWVTQKSHPYFNPAVQQHLPDVQNALQAAIDAAASAIENRSTPE